jgi:hypothetical protein
MPGWFDIFGLDPSSPEDSAGFAESAERVHALIHKEVGVLFACLAHLPERVVHIAAHSALSRSIPSATLPVFR